MKVSDNMNERSINLYQRDYYTGRKKTIVKDGIAVKDYWVQDFAKNRHFVKKGTKVNEYGFPLKEKEME